MVVVAMVAWIVVLSVVTKVLVWDVAIMNMVVVVEALVIGMLADVEIVVAGVIAIALYAADVPSDVAVNSFMDELTGVMLVGLPGIGIEVFVDANTYAFAVVTVLEFPVSIRLEGFSC